MEICLDSSFAGSTVTFSNFSGSVLDLALCCLTTFLSVLTAMKLILKTHAEVIASAGKGGKLNIGKIATIVPADRRNANFLLPIILFFLDFIGFRLLTFFLNFLNMPSFLIVLSLGSVLKLLIFSFAFCKLFLKLMPLFKSFSAVWLSL